MSDPPSPEIVLIEDNEDELVTMLRALRRHEFEPSLKVIRDGRVALEYVQDLRDAVSRGMAPPKAVFLDLRLPGADGKQVLARLRAHQSTREVPVVVLSSTQRESEIEACYRLGANSFISKEYGGKRPGEYIVRAMRYWLELNRTAS